MKLYISEKVLHDNIKENKYIEQKRLERCIDVWVDEFQRVGTEVETVVSPQGWF